MQIIGTPSATTPMDFNCRYSKRVKGWPEDQMVAREKRDFEIHDVRLNMMINRICDIKLNMRCEAEGNGELSKLKIDRRN